MGYRYVNGHVNSGIDACILCENFVKFGPADLEIICLREIIKKDAEDKKLEMRGKA